MRMVNILNTLKFLSKQPLQNILRRLKTILSNKIYLLLGLNSKQRFSIPDNFIIPKIDNSYIDLHSLNTTGLDSEIVSYHLNKYLNHQFDLLGSGWIEYSYAVNPIGIEGVKFKIPDFCFEDKMTFIENIVPKAYHKHSKKIWNLLDVAYKPIDWQRDYKSGYRWDAREPNSKQRKNIPIGADLKMPWELSRLQFLPQLATFAVKDDRCKERIISEYKNVLLDFIGANVPEYGVNWVSTMDVAIRATNMLVAYDILTQIDKNEVLDGEFKQIFQKSIFDHGYFIINNLEYSEIITQNHYLANICGLFFISSYLETNNLTKTWLAFSTQEILNEIPKQFYKDGGSFEASTSYHRLSSEMLIYTLAIMTRVVGNDIEIFSDLKKIKWKIKPKLDWKKVNSLSEQVFSESLQKQLHRIGKFTNDIIKPDGEIPQFGDNDSGRFLKFTPTGSFITNKKAEENYDNLKGYNAHCRNNLSDLYFDENTLNHITLLAAYSGVFSNDSFADSGRIFPLEKSIVESLLGKQMVQVVANKSKLINPKKINTTKLAYEKTYIYNLNHLVDLGSLKESYYPDFGIYVLKSLKDDFYLSVFFGSNGQNGLGGHSHNDKLSFELYENGLTVFRDPGTYLYTPFPAIRNKFRSVFVHNSPVHNRQEQDKFKEGRSGLFRLFDNHKCSVIDVTTNSIKLLLEYEKVKHIRKFKIASDKLIINDFSNFPFEQNFFSDAFFSNGYGKLTKFENT